MVIEIPEGQGIDVLVFAAGEIIASATVTPVGETGSDVEVRIVDPALASDVVGVLKEITHSFNFVANFSSRGWQPEEKPPGDVPF